MKVLDELRDKVKGRLSFDIIDNRTGEVVESYEENNVVVLTSREIIIKRIFDDNNSFKVERFKIGDDTGNGTSDDPEPADETITANDMSVLYSQDGITLNTNNSLKTIINVFISGDSVLEQFPDQDTIQFTSFGLFSLNDTLFSYRRVPALTITENFSINISWEIFFEE